MGTIYIVIASILWGMVHSVLAGNGFKHIARKAFGATAFYRLYRFAYNVFALVSFFPILLMLVTFPDRPLYSIPSPWLYLMTVIQGLAAFVMIAAVMQTGVFEFAGLAQLSFGYDDSKPTGLIVDGLYAFVRHPIYTASLIFIWFSPEMTLNRLVLWLIFSIYIVIGAAFEEKKMQKEFGSEYAEYRTRTPMLIPGWHKNT